VCHGALGFIQARKPDGSLLVNGTNMSAVTDRQIEQLGIASLTPLHPEDALKERGAHFFATRGVLTDIDQSKVVVDGQLVTGQNQNSACETAQRMLDQIQPSS
jgi:putative intracellular protease/amidase